MVGCDTAEPDLEGYGEKICINAGMQTLWMPVTVMEGGIWVDWVTARSSAGESSLGQT